MNARIINVRINLYKEKHRQAWAALQQLREEKGWSYSESFSEALVAFMASGRMRYIGIDRRVLCRHTKSQKPVPVSASYFRLIAPPVTGLSSISAVYSTVIDRI